MKPIFLYIQGAQFLSVYKYLNLKQKNFYQKLVTVFVVIALASAGLFLFILSDPQDAVVPAASTWTLVSDTDFNNGTMENVTIIGNGDEAELIVSLPGAHQWIKKTPKVMPPIRRNSELATIYDYDKVMIFGGYKDGIGYLNDTWVYDLSDNNWTNKNPENAPSPRHDHFLAAVYGTDKVVLYSGRYGTLFTDTWVYDLSENKWTKKSPPNNPGFRWYAAMASIYGDDKVVMFGGWVSHDETWVYDLSDDKWTQMYPRTNPGGRSHHEMAAIYGDDKVVLFGGYTTLDDTWVYDLSDNNWTKKSPETKPAGRYLQSMSPIHGSDNVVMFGGFMSNDDTWVYDLTKEEWTKISLKNKTNKPGIVFEHGMAPINGTNKVILYGASANDIWIYQHDLSIRNGTYISEPYYTGANSSFHEIIWNMSSLENTSIKFQLRTGATEAELTSGAFIGPEGTTTTYYSSSPSDLWQGHFGDKWVQFKSFFTMNVYTDPPELKGITIKYNGLPGIIVISPSNGTLLTKNKPKFTWTFIDYDSEYQHAFQVLIDDDINFTSVDFDSRIQNTSKQHWDFPLGTNYTELPDGTLYWKVRTCDVDGDWTDYSQPRVLRIDTHTPTSAPAWPVNDGYYNSLDIISGIANDQTNGSGVAKVEITLKRLSDNTFWDGNEWVQLPTWIITTGTTAWTYDSSTVLWDSGRKYSIQSRATDNATNIEHPGDGFIFSIDMDEPLTNIEIPEDSVWLNQLDTISGTSLDISGSGIEKVEINVKCIKNEIQLDANDNVNNYWDGKEWTSKELWLPVSGEVQWSYDSSSVQWSTGDHYQLRCRATDKSGNMEPPLEGNTNTIMFDSTKPEAISIYINNGEEYTTSNEVVLSLQAKDVGSGISQMASSADNSKWSEWIPFTTEMNFTLSPIDSEKTVFFRVRDYAGNIAEAVFDSIILDTAPPEDLIMLINDGAEFTNSNKITIKLNAFDALSGLGEMSLSFDGVSWTGNEAFQSTKTIQFPPGDGKKIIFLKVTDNAGNIAKPIVGTIIMDTSPPQSLSIIISGGITETTSTLVFLELQAKDLLSGVDKISFSTDNKTWDSWEDYSKIRYYDLLSGEGMKTIYFRSRDRAGNIADPVFTTIFLNTTSIEDSPPEKTSPSKETVYFPFIILIIIILIVMTALWFVISMKQMKKLEQELLLPGALTVKPGALPGTAIISKQVPGAPTHSMLPETTSVPTTPQPTISATPTPKLAKTAQGSITESPTPSTTHQQLPQLPPAQTDNTEPKLREPTPLTIPTPTLAQSPTLQTLTAPTIALPLQHQEQVKEQQDNDEKKITE